MPRNAEIVRQWNILRQIESARLGMSVAQLSDETGVTRRTIYRDLDALQEAGFPIYNEMRDGHAYWKLGDAPFGALTRMGFSLSELCALSLSRRLVEVLTGVPFQSALSGAFGKFEQTLPPKMQAYLSRLPSIMSARPAAGKVRKSPNHEQFVERLVEASVERRQVEMRYYSLSSDRTRDYLVYPLRVVCMYGGMYLRAWVPDYNQLRTFATQRIQRVSVGENRFAMAPEWAEEPFAESLGPNEGPAVHVVLEFAPGIAPLVRERVYHPSQRTTSAADGSLVIELDVCDDVWLRSLILQFGHQVKVLAPPSLAREVLDDLKTAVNRYAPGIQFDGLGVSSALLDLSTQSRLPL